MSTEGSAAAAAAGDGPAAAAVAGPSAPDARLRIALIGYGEVGRILAEDLIAGGHAVAAWDVKLDAVVSSGDRSSELTDAVSDATPAPLRGPAAAPLHAHAAAHGTRLAASCADAVHDAGLVVSAVTASQAVPVARGVASALAAGAFVLDLNSASPGAKREAARIVDAAGGRYVEGAVMTSVPPYRIGVPLRLGGPHAEAAAPRLRVLGFAPTVASAELGVASATKMCRSVMIKGLEAMVIESFTAARAHGVEDAVIASLQETFPGIDWERQAAYFFQRVIEHGRRRAEEVREVALTVREAGLEPWSAEGTAERQAAVADLADAGVFGKRGEPGFARSADWRVEADRLLAHRRAEVVGAVGGDTAPVDGDGGGDAAAATVGDAHPAAGVAVARRAASA